MAKSTDDIIALATEAGAEIDKFDQKGNASAAKRGRKMLQEIKQLAAVERKRIQNAKNARAV
jgi:hypothetical protein